ncbi:MAG: succinylglutamate desuccinylase/aspartoacylase family protein [Bacillota bacterium]|nr:succinylglutamate desuccinylase/aspartoacylase family protein [Bacillota bacterium]
MDYYQMGPVKVKPGTTAFGHVPVANRPDGTMVNLPVIVAHGVEPGPTLVVGACCHGDEHEGTMTVIRLGREIDPQRLKGTFIGVPVINVPAFHNMRRGNPYDLYILDMNRIFPGRPDGFLTERIAHTFFQEIVSRADLLIDLHSGANILVQTELVCYERPDSLELAKAVGGPWDILWKGDTFGSGTSNGAAARLGIPSVMLELGGAGGRFDHFEENVDKFVHGIANVMKHFRMLEGTPDLPREYTVVQMLPYPCNHGGLIVPEPGLRLRQWVKQGEKVMSVIDFFGREVEEIRAPFDALVCGRRVYPVVHAGEWAIFLGQRTTE